MTTHSSKITFVKVKDLGMVENFFQELLLSDTDQSTVNDKKTILELFKPLRELVKEEICLANCVYEINEEYYREVTEFICKATGSIVATVTYFLFAQPNKIERSDKAILSTVVDDIKEYSEQHSSAVTKIVFDRAEKCIKNIISKKKNSVEATVPTDYARDDDGEEMPVVLNVAFIPYKKDNLVFGLKLFEQKASNETIH